MNDMTGEDPSDKKRIINHCGDNCVSILSLLTRLCAEENVSEQTKLETIRFTLGYFPPQMQVIDKVIDHFIEAGQFAYATLVARIGCTEHALERLMKQLCVAGEAGHAQALATSRGVSIRIQYVETLVACFERSDGSNWALCNQITQLAREHCTEGTYEKFFTRLQAKITAPPLPVPATEPSRATNPGTVHISSLPKNNALAANA